MKKDERSRGQKRERKGKKKAGECRSGGVELLRKIHKKHTQATTHTPATPTHTQS